MSAGALPPTRSAERVSVGEELPELVIDVTTSLVVAGALASRDYQDVHHDHAAAVRSGARDVFMNILTTGGLVGRFVTDWAGPEALLRSVDIRLGVPNYAGDTMRLTGRVSWVETGGGESRVDVEVRGTNSLGDHVTGTVSLVLPEGP